MVEQTLEIGTNRTHGRMLIHQSLPLVVENLVVLLEYAYSLVQRRNLRSKRTCRVHQFGLFAVVLRGECALLSLQTVDARLQFGGGMPQSGGGAVAILFGSALLFGQLLGGPLFRLGLSLVCLLELFPQSSTLVLRL